MTGYGRAAAEGGGLAVTVEIRTLNHRHLDMHLRIAPGLLALEDEVRRLIGARLHRGRVECTVSYDESEGGRRTVKLDEPLLHDVAEVLRKVQAVLGTVEPLKVADVAAVADVWRVEARPVDEAAALGVLREAVESALDDVVAMRRTEGRTLAEDLFPRMEAVAACAKEVARHGPEVVASARRRVLERVQQLLGDQPLDPDRIAQEAAILADRADVSEELARIHSHLEQLKSRLETGGPVGRTMDFLLQELNREWNTVGSKIHDADVTLIVVQARAELEKMREQVQNIQ